MKELCTSLDSLLSALILLKKITTKANKISYPNIAVISSLPSIISTSKESTTKETANVRVVIINKQNQILYYDSSAIAPSLWLTIAFIWYSLTLAYALYIKYTKFTLAAINPILTNKITTIL